MAHNVNSMAYFGEKPWHGLGTKLEKVATAAEAMVAAGLNWLVGKRELFLRDGTKVQGSYATVREDTGKVLGVVGDVYRPLQNREAFSFFDAVVGEKLAMYHTAGSLGLGERVWILAKLPGTIRVVGDDISEKYLLLTNTHDGSASVGIMWTPIRVVCQNTLNVALRDSSRAQKLRHSASIGLRVKNVREGLGFAMEQFDVFQQQAQALAAVQVNGDGWKQMLREVGILPADAAKDADASSRSKNIAEELTAMFEGAQMGGRLPGVKGTAWGAFNAVSEYVDYRRSTKGEDKLAGRANSLLFGSGATLKQAAWDAATALL